MWRKKPQNFWKDYQRKMDNYHETVMVSEVLEALNVLLKSQARYIDATLGTGGHAEAILERGAEVLGIDLDPQMLKIAEERLKKFGKKVKFAKGNFRNIDILAKENGFDKVDGIIFDLGTSNLQLTSAERGFSFANPEAPLDMRFEPEEQGVKGSDLLNGLREDQLRVLFGGVLGWHDSQRLARRVATERLVKPFQTVDDFLKIARVGGKERLNPATLPFLALRIAVNSELENLEEGLLKAYVLLKKGGKLAVITFHSGEDAIVKHFGKRVGGLETKKPIKPSPEEIAQNPKARSAKLRIIEKWQTGKEKSQDLET